MPANSPWSTVFFIVLMVAAFYFLIIRPQRKRQQALQQTMSALEPGTRVMLTSGLFGTVMSVGPRQAVLEISPGVELTVLKQAISRVATAADEDFEYEEDSPAALDPEGAEPPASDRMDEPPYAGPAGTGPQPTKE